MRNELSNGFFISLKSKEPKLRLIFPHKNEIEYYFFVWSADLNVQKEKVSKHISKAHASRVSKVSSKQINTFNGS